MANRIFVYPVIQRHAISTVSTVSCATLNVRSARNKVTAIHDLIAENKLGILALTETWHEDSDSITISQLRELNYNIVEQARPIPIDARTDNIQFINHGGVALLSVSGLKLSKHTISGHFTTFEHVCARVSSSGLQCLIVVIYRPGSMAVNQLFFKQFAELLESLSILSMIIYITGDVNVRLDSTCQADTIQLLQLFSAYGLVQHVDQPTHSQGGIIDAVIAREGVSLHPITVSDVGLSDHFLIAWTLKMSRPEPVYRTVKRRDWKAFNNDRFMDDLVTSNLCDQDVLDDQLKTADEMSSNYDSVLFDLLDHHAPARTITVRERISNAWFDNECRLSKANVRALEKRYRSSNNSADHKLWIDSLKELHKLYNKKKALNTIDAINADKDNPRGLWRTLNSTLGLNKSRQISSHLHSILMIKLQRLELTVRVLHYQHKVVFYIRML